MNSSPHSNPADEAAAALRGKIEPEALAFVETIPNEIKPLIAALTHGIEGCTELLRSPVVPDWVAKLGAKVRSEMFPCAASWNDSGDDFHTLGKGLGLIHATMLSLGKLNAATEPSEFEFFAASSRLEQVAPHFAGMAASLSPEHAAAFIRGYGEGIVEDPIRSIYSEGELQFRTQRFLLRFILLCIWPRVETMKSTTELFHFLVPHLGENALGDLETFQRRCREMGLFRRKPHANK